MKRIFITLIFSICLAQIPAYSAEKIDGGFGITLGQTFEPSSAIGKGELTDGTPMYQFSPQNPYRSFQKYYVMITPITNKVYSIWGIGQSENDSTCKKEQAVIIEILKEKYGNKEKEDLTSALFDIQKIDQGNRYIISKCSGFIDTTIDIRYYDRSLNDQAEKERIKTESKKVNSTGF